LAAGLRNFDIFDFALNGLEGGVLATSQALLWACMPSLLEQVREVIRARHYSLRT
jgi:hypothetical protein